MSPTLTVVTSVMPPVLSKQYSLGADGGLVKMTSANLYDGSYQVKEVEDLSAMARLLTTLGPGQALVFGTPRKLSGQIVTAAELPKHSGETSVVARTNECFAFQQSPGWMFLDYDPDPGTEALEPEELVRVLRGCVPDLFKAGAVVYPSSSSHIVRTEDGKDLTGSRGLHLYVPVDRAAGIPDACRNLQARLWDAGQGRIVVSASGSLLERTLLDASTAQPARLDFAAGAVCGAGLEQRRGIPLVVSPADPQIKLLRLDKCLKKPKESKRITDIIVSAKQDKRDEAARIRNYYVEKRAEEETKTVNGGRDGTEEEVAAARKTILAMLSGQALPADFVLQVLNGEMIVPVRVCEVMAKPEVFDGVHCLDPAEPDYQGRKDVGIIYMDKEPRVFSFAHGGKLYRMLTTPGGPPDVYYDQFKREYLTKDERGEWMGLTLEMCKRYLAGLGIARKPECGEQVSPLDKLCTEIERAKNVHFSGPLAGYPSGYYETADGRLLVTRSPTMIQPVEGNWSYLREYLEGMLGNEADQVPLLYGWLQGGYRCLVKGPGFFRPGHALVLVGVAGCAKSLLQALISEILGGRSAKPYMYMSGATDFNADLFAAEHLVIEDEKASRDMKSRRMFGAHIKNVTVNVRQRRHAKHVDAEHLVPFWRLSVSLNEDTEDMLVLPPLDDGVADKMLMFRCGMSKMVEGWDPSIEAREANFRRLKADLPGFLWFLTEEFVLPTHLEGPRFGLTSFVHPYIRNALNSLGEPLQILSLIDQELFVTGDRTWRAKEGDPVVMNAHALQQILVSSTGSSFEARKLLHYAGALEKYLTWLERHTTRVRKGRRVDNLRTWVIDPPTNDQDTERTDEIGGLL